MRANILVVDDRRENLCALEALLEAPDRTIFTALSGNEALQLVLVHEVALILMDVEMPGLDGYETARILRGTKRTRLIPIIFVTAGDRTDERTFRGYESGAIDFLFKPINTFMLKSKVDLFVQLHLKTRDLERTSATLRERVADLEYVHQTLSHDLRAPLRSIRAFSQIALGSAPLVPEAQDALDRVLKASSRMAAMVEDLYTLLCLSAVPADPVPTELATTVRHALEALHDDVEASGAVVTFDELPKIVTSRQLVTQTLQNLIANAIRFRGASPPVIAIRANRVRDAWQIDVSDNGVGIPANACERVFELFAKLDPERSGSGVGLALCRRAVDRIGGRIWIESSCPAGTTVCFTVPVAPSLEA